MALAVAAPGWFGKLSSLGDFASRRLSPDWVQACDGWLSAGLSTSQQQLGDRWLPTYLAAPVSRFAWAPGVVDAQWWFGVLMPSCDKVGRYFPLLVAQPRALPPSERYALDHLDLWWAQAARAVLQTLDDGADVDAFEAALDAMPPWPGARAGGTAVMPDGNGLFDISAGVTLTDLAHGLADTLLQQRLAGHSLWWPWRAELAASRCRIVQGLPDAAAFATTLFSRS